MLNPYQKGTIESAVVSNHSISLLPHRFQVMFAMFCARQVEFLWGDFPQYVKAIKMVEGWLDGEVSIEECKEHCYFLAGYTEHTSEILYAMAAVYGTLKTTWDPFYASYAAFNTACCIATYYDAAIHYAADAASSSHDTSNLPASSVAIEMANAMNASKENALKAQWEYYRELLHFDDIAEKALLGEAADA